MAYTCENLERAVSVFYGSEHSDRAEAHRWLTEAQRCPQAWSFVWELLDEGRSTEIRFFAATTLHTKLQRCWGELPPDAHDELRERIMRAIASSFRGPKIVLNRLCIGLAAFVLRQRGRGLLQIADRLSASVPLLIEVLSVVPEEFNNMTMPTADRAAVRLNLQQMTPRVLDTVLEHLRRDPAKDYADGWAHHLGIWQGACQCAGAWIQLGGVSPADCVPTVTAALQILHVIYAGPQSPEETRRTELSQAELEACESALNSAAAALTQPDSGRHPTACRHMMRLVLDAVEPMLRAEDVLHAPNEDLVVALYGTLVAAGEYHGRWIASAVVEDAAAEDGPESRDCANDLLRLLLRCSGAAGAYPTQESHSKLAFSFWFTLQDEGLSAARDENSSPIKNALRIWYEQLVVILLRKSTMSSHHRDFTAEDDELMRCYRQDVADTLVYCHMVLGDPLIVQLENLMRNFAINCLSDGGYELEAIIHAFLALAEFVLSSATPSLFSLMRVLTELPYDKLHQQVLLTALSCFIAYADWLGSIENPAAEEIVGKALTIIWTAMESKDMTSLAVLALKALCKECSKHLKPHAHQLLQAFQSGLHKWSPLVVSQIMRAAGCTAASLPPPEAAPYLTSLMMPLIEKLEVTKKKPISPKHVTLCVSTLQQASALILSLLESEIKHTYIPLTLILPTFGDIAQHAPLTEPLFKLIKLVIIRLQDECVPLLPDLVRVTIISLEVEPHPTNIEVCKLMSLLIPEMGGNAFSIAVNAVLRISGESIGRAEDLSTHAPLLDSFYLALHSILKKKPNLMLSFEHQIENIIQLGLLTICLPEQGPTKSACHFFDVFSKVHPNRLFPHGPTLVHRIVHCIGILVPRNHVDPYVELLWKLGRVNWPDSINGDSVQGPTQISNWLKDALRETNFPTELATLEVKDKFIKAAYEHFSHRRRFMETAREFILTCRGLLNHYGEITQTVDLY